MKNPASKKLLFGLAGVLVLGAIVAVVVALKHSSIPDLATNYASRPILLDLPNDARLARQNPRGTTIANLLSLPKPAASVHLVSAGHFEPAGLQFPDGLRVTWPLTEQRKPSSALWILELDAQAKRWSATVEPE